MRSLLAAFLTASLLGAVARAQQSPGRSAPSPTESPPDDLRSDVSRLLTDALLDRCAKFLSERNRAWSRDVGMDACAPNFLEMASYHVDWLLGVHPYEPRTSELTPQEARVCRIAGDGYFVIRTKLLHEIFLTRFPLGRKANGAIENYDTLLREFERHFGLPAVQKIEAHAEPLRNAYHEFIDDPLLPVSGLLNRVSPDPALTPAERGRATVQGLIDHLTSGEFLSRYLDMRRRWAGDPRVDTTLKYGPWGVAHVGNAVHVRQLDREANWAPDPAYKERPEEAACLDALEATGMALVEAELFECYLEYHEQHVAVGRDWDEYRRNLGEAAYQYFETQRTLLPQQLARIDVAARLARVRPQTKPGHGPQIRVLVTYSVPDSRSDVSFHLIDPSGRPVWSCEPLVRNGRLTGPCLQGSGWFTTPGRYHLEILRGKDPAAGADATLDGSETRLEVSGSVSSPPTVAISRVVASPTMLELGGHGAYSVEWTLTNRSTRTLRSVGATWAASVSIETAGILGWERTTSPAVLQQQHEALAPGESIHVSVTNPRFWRTYPAPAWTPAIRASVDFMASDSPEGTWEEATAPVAALEFDGSSPRRGRDDGVSWHGFGSPVFTASGLLAIQDGQIVRVSQGQPKPVLPADPNMARIVASRDGMHIAVLTPKQLALSADGGTTFTVTGLTPEFDLMAAFAGPDLLWPRSTGLVRVTPDGRSTTTELPGETSWLAASFSDDRRGVLLGIDGLILTTEDGGATWDTHTSDLALASIVRVGWTLIAAGEDGLYRSDDDGGTFALVMSSHRCGPLAASCDRVVAVCVPLMPFISPVWTSTDLRTFSPVPVQYPLPLRAIALGPQPGAPIAAATYEAAMLTGDPSGLALAPDLPQTSELEVKILETQTPWSQWFPAVPEVTKTVPADDQ